MRSPVFSIITPTCRRPLLLKRNILSVKNQKFEDYEHIIIDDADDGETARIIAESNDKRIIFLKNQESKGPSGSYNSGIKVSKGTFITFLDDDDEYLPGMLEKAYRHLSQTDKNIGFVWTGISRVKDTPEGEIFVSSNLWPSAFSDKETRLIAATTIGNGYGVCMKRECIGTTGLYDESLEFGQDTDFLFRLADNFECETIPEVLVRIHIHENNRLSDDRNNALRLALREIILNKHKDLLRIYPKLFEVHYRALSELAYRLKHKGKGRDAMLKVIKNNPLNMLNLADLVSFEITGKNLTSLYRGSSFWKLNQMLKGKKQQRNKTFLEF